MSDDFKKKASDMFWGAAKGLSDICQNHPDEVRVIVPLAAGAVAGAGALLKNHKKHRREENHKSCEFYDPRTHRWTFTRRPLKPQEQFEVARRYAAGESYEEIFYRMRLLK